MMWMKAKIAVATVSGKAYYLLVTELNKKKQPFLSLTPWNQIPLSIEVVITTEKERNLIHHPNILTYKEGDDPSKIVAEAVRLSKGKQRYEKLVIGIDPGKTFGMAVLGDGHLIETLNCPSKEEAVHAVLDSINKAPADQTTVKVGDGPPAYTEALLNSLDEMLPPNVGIEIVSEAGTTHVANEAKRRREIRDIMSAMRIAKRNGQTFSRGKKNEPHGRTE